MKKIELLKKIYTLQLSLDAQSCLVDRALTQMNYLDRKMKRMTPYLHHQFGCKFEPMESPCTCGLDRFLECK